MYVIQINPTATQNIKLLTAALSTQYQPCSAYESLNFPYEPTYPNCKLQRNIYLIEYFFVIKKQHVSSERSSQSLFQNCLPLMYL
jgi:hypothetical protein